MSDLQQLKMYDWSITSEKPVMSVMRGRSGAHLRSGIVTSLEDLVEIEKKLTRYEVL